MTRISQHLRHRPRLQWVLVYLLVIACASAAPARAQSDRHLILEEVASYIVPDSFLVAGLAASGSGSVLALPAPAFNSHVLLFDGEGEALELGAGVLKEPVAATFVQGDSVFEVVDLTLDAIVRMNTDGRVISKRPFVVPISVKAAARTAAGWFLAGRDVYDQLRIYHLSAPAGKESFRQLVALIGEPSETIPYIHMSPIDPGVLFTSVTPPFGVLRVGTDSVLDRLSFDPRLLEFWAGAKRTGRFRPSWLSFPALALDHGYLQTIADVRSDTRVLIRYNERGEVVEHTVIRAPLGFVTSVPRTRRLAGVRKMGQQEIVLYEWRWSGSTPHPEKGEHHEQNQ